MKTIILVLCNRSALEKVEGLEFDSMDDVCNELTSYGVTDEQYDSFGHYDIYGFAELINNQEISISDAFIGHIKLRK